MAADGLVRALERLSSWTGRHVPFVEQHTGADCGAACLAMVLGYHGKNVELEAVRQTIGFDREGTRADVILDGARLYGLTGRGISLDVDDLDYLEPATILHWNFRHYVVFERLHRDAIEIVDPALGRRRVSLDEVKKSFTGVALCFEPGENFVAEKQRRRGWRRHAQVLFQHAPRLRRIWALSLFIQLLTLALPIVTGALIDRVIPRADHHVLAVLFAGLAGAVIFYFLAFFLRAHFLVELRTLIDVRTTMGFVDHLLSLPLSFFRRRSSGDLMMRLNSNATIREIMTSSVLSSSIDAILAVVYLALLMILHVGLGLVVLALAVAQVGVFFAARRRQHELLAENLLRQARTEDYQVEMMNGVETLKVLGCEQRAVERWSDLFVEVLNASLSRGRLAAIVDSLVAMLKMASPLAVLGYGATLVLSNELTLGTMLALSALAAGFLAPLGNMVATLGQLQLLGTIVDRIDDVLDSESEHSRSATRTAPVLSGQISVERVSFRYGPVSPLVLDDVSFEVAPGQVVAIVGPSGSGKSTLASLLVGLYRPTNGRILYDGANLDDVDLRSLRRQIGTVSQNPYLFGGTVRANIALAHPKAPLDEVLAAAKRACIHEEIEAMGLAYDTPLADGGASLSGGQRQRVALARALMGKPSVLILDEATSALDAVTEQRVHESLAGLGSTRIIIAHRLSTVAAADLILVLEGGRIVERGTHRELLEKRGVYATLVGAQRVASDAR